MFSTYERMVDANFLNLRAVYMLSDSNNENSCFGKKKFRYNVEKQNGKRKTFSESNICLVVWNLIKNLTKIY